MKTATKLLDQIRDIYSVSDYGIARMTGFSVARISNYRRGLRSLDNEAVFVLCDLLDIDPVEIICVVEIEKAKNEENKRFWNEKLNEIKGR